MVVDPLSAKLSDFAISFPAICPHIDVDVPRWINQAVRGTLLPSDKMTEFLETTSLTKGVVPARAADPGGSPPILQNQRPVLTREVALQQFKMSPSRAASAPHLHPNLARNGPALHSPRKPIAKRSSIDTAAHGLRL